MKFTNFLCMGLDIFLVFRTNSLSGELQFLLFSTGKCNAKMEPVSMLCSFVAVLS